MSEAVSYVYRLTSAHLALGGTASEPSQGCMPRMRMTASTASSRLGRTPSAYSSAICATQDHYVMRSLGPVVTELVCLGLQHAGRELSSACTTSALCTVRSKTNIAHVGA